MSNQNLQIFIVVLVINVMMSSIRSPSCFDVNVPAVNNENDVSKSIRLLTWPISGQVDKIRQWIIDMAEWLFLTPYPSQEKNAFVSSNRPRSLSNFSATDKKSLEMLKGCSENDTLIGPDMPWVEFVETELYVSAYKKPPSFPCLGRLQSSYFFEKRYQMLRTPSFIPIHVFPIVVIRSCRPCVAHNFKL